MIESYPDYVARKEKEAAASAGKPEPKAKTTPKSTDSELGVKINGK